MRTFILIGKSRKTGKDELILGRDAKGSDHISAYKKLAAQSTSEDYENVVLVESSPFKRQLKFITKAEKEAREKAHKEAVAVAEKSAKKSAAGKKAAKTETKTEGEDSPKTETK